MTAPFRISVYNAAFEPQDWAGAPNEAHFNLRYNAASVGSFTLDGDDEQVGVLTAAGSRVVVEYFHDPADPWNPMFLMSGPIAERKGEGSPSSTRTFDIQDDWVDVFNMLGLPNPAGTMSQQGDDEAYYTVTDNAETVLKTLVDVNAAWLGVPVTTATDLGRGDSITVSVRMHKIGERLFPAVTQAGCGVTVRQSGAGVVVDCFESDVLTDPLTEASGVVVSGSFVTNPPTVTRAIVGGGGEGTARVFRMVIDTAAEALWGVARCVFVDARDTTDTAILDARAWQAIREGAATAGVTAALAETEDFRFGVAVNIGDVVSVELDGAPPVTDVVTEAQFDWTASAGLVVTPRVGEAETTFEQIAASAIEQVAKRTRDQDARS